MSLISTATRTTAGPMGTAPLGSTYLREAGIASEGVQVSEEGLRCFMSHATAGRSSTHLSAGDVASALWYTTCEECDNYPQSRTAIDPRTKPECANASLEFPVVDLAESLCSHSSDCIGFCSLYFSFVQAADSDADGFINDTELLELGALSGVSSLFVGMGACLGAWIECPLNTTPMSHAVVAVASSVFFDYDATDCSACSG
mmetsp:Transcript_107929/g.247438  ORF Transcript_107929/g.247438 Transcript_107929/m.247438 type:complete len:202 (+) Transcript_107929:1207-1812(+)